MSSAITRSRLPLFAVLCTLAVLMLCAASSGLAFVRASSGEVPGGAEGDPIDSNDFGGGGGGNGDDVEDSGSMAPAPRLPIFRFGGWTILIVPDGTLGGAGLSVRIVDWGVPAQEARDAQ